MPLHLTAQMALGLFFTQRYRFLTIDQFARAAGMRRETAGNQLRGLQTAGILGHFGNTGLGGQGKTPKVYYLTRKGWEFLRRESGIEEELIGAYREIHTEASWSPVMYHRLRTVDCLISGEVAVRNRSTLSMVQTFMEYKRVRKQGNLIRATTDFVADPPISDNRIIPDGAFIIENIETGKRALFFVEMDMATMRITSAITRDKRLSLYHKVSQYDRYLQSLRYRQTYRQWGDFSFFTLLFVTFGQTRIDNIRQSLVALPAQLSAYYRFTEYKAAMGDFLGAIWKARNAGDSRLYSLVRE